MVSMCLSSSLRKHMNHSFKDEKGSDVSMEMLENEPFKLGTLLWLL